MEYPIMNIMFEPIYNQLKGRHDVTGSAHIDIVPGYEDANSDFFHFCMTVFEEINQLLWSESGRNLPIISFPLEATSNENKFLDFKIDEIKKAEEPPCIYMCSEFDLFSFAAEEVIVFRRHLIRGYYVLLKSWRDEEHVRNNWEFSNVCFIWRSRDLKQKHGSA